MKTLTEKEIDELLSPLPEDSDLFSALVELKEARVLIRDLEDEISQMNDEKDWEGTMWNPND